MNIVERIKKLKQEQNAIILAHYYTNDEIQAIADYVGDSFYLSKIAKNNTASMIVFCGVHFMAETAKILSPDKLVILPVKMAGCQMADTIEYEKLLAYKKQNPEDKIICYVNTSAKIKSLCDVCVTSSNAVKILSHYQNDKVLYVPDQNLAKYYNHLTTNTIKHWDGYCQIHHNITTYDVELAKKSHPNALLLVHPEAQLEILLQADFIGSTKEMIDFVKTCPSKEYIVGTEEGILYSLNKENPDKKFYKLSNNLICKTMKMTSLEDIENALLQKGKRYLVIDLDVDVINKAQIALNKMLELGK